MPPPSSDKEFMERALGLAHRGRGSVEPNPMVGAVVVKGGRIVGEGFHERFGGPHAEMQALETAGEAARGATMYVTLEPCAHEGKTPPCAPLVADAGIARVVTPTLDPTTKTRGKGLILLNERGVETEIGLCREEAVRLNAGFFKLAAEAMPLVTAKWAMSVDGKIATRTGSSRWISSAAARHKVHQLRAVVDCIMVGSRTVLQDDPLLTCRHCEAKRTASRLVVCGAGIVPKESQLVRTVSDAPVLLAFPQGNAPQGLRQLQELGCEAVPVRAVEDRPDRIDMTALMHELARREMTNVLVEGGGELLGALFDAALVDNVMVFIAPIVIGGRRATGAVAGLGKRTVEEAARLRECRTSPIGSDILLEAWVSDPTEWLP